MHWPCHLHSNFWLGYILVLEAIGVPSMYRFTFQFLVRLYTEWKDIEPLVSVKFTFQFLVRLYTN